MSVKIPTRNSRKKLIIVFVAIISFFSCDHKVKFESGLYYWKTSDYYLNTKDYLFIKNHKIDKLYIKFFELDKDPLKGIYPISKSQINLNKEFYIGESQDSINVQVVPVVFIPNKVFKDCSKSLIDSLAENILYLIHKKYNEQIFPYSASRSEIIKEIQIDCDWTKSTKENYFYLLQRLKSKSKTQISCTLRLYPFKHRERMGIPPVDRVTLMCYNMLSPLQAKNKNSILDLVELEKYLLNTTTYPLEMDIVLPVFSWYHVFHNNTFKGLVHDLNEIDSTKIAQVKPLWYEIKEDMVVGDLLIKKGDMLKFETVDAANVFAVKKMIQKHIRFSSTTTLSLFHLDQTQFNQYRHEDFLRFYTPMAE